MADPGEIRRFGPADSDDKVLAGKHMDLAELNLLQMVQVPGGAQHQEQRVAVVFQLGPLVSGERVLHGQVARSNSSATERSSSGSGR